ncbi:hypothetical protein SARC_06510 [Sphaeroforma arctica JP610]|uniref:Uncharacterized protein n=1 Tax=Sphaeroforma arctica JP610 TaxID=667725 RepID=A0A0L0FYY0_9EUKA|nr:hypothetical protein SARC_06510 [Sphaeroforma arctica JP610]KNC81158.1 hypothetical protein SARC_06510 [Sphaeroforma arctica JP610]|eukprot:XP_014155060.1 hypothetical protein SARC_06510 [Sphaeroforma arctica JP610]
MEPMSGEEEDIFRRLSIGDRNVLHRSRGNSTDSERSRTGIMESDRRPSVSPVPELPMIEDESPNKEGGLPDKEGGLPNMDSNLSLDKREDKRKVTIYRDRNMVYKLIGDINGDGFLGKVDSLQSAADLAAMYPEIRGFVYHSARMPGKYAGRVYGWNEERYESV